MPFEVSGIKRRKISAPIHLLNVDAPNFLAPETNNDHERTTTTINDDIDDIDENSTSMETKSSVQYSNDTTKPRGRPITQIFENFNKSKINVARSNLSEFSDIFAANQTESTSVCFEDTGKFSVKFDVPPAQKGNVIANKGLVENRIRPNVAKEKAPPTSDVWLMLEENAITSTLKKPAVNKTIKFPHKLKEQLQQKREYKTKLRQTTLGIPSTKSTLKGKKRGRKPKKQIQAEIELKHKENPVEDIHIDTESKIQIVASDDLVQSSQLISQADDPSTVISSPTVSYKKRAKERQRTKIRSQIQERIESGPESKEEPEHNIAKSDHSPLASEKSYYSADLSDLEWKEKEETTKLDHNSIAKIPNKEISSKRITRSKDPKMKPIGMVHDIQERNKTEMNELVLAKNKESIEDGFQTEIHNGLNLLTESLINRMKLVELEISRKEMKLKDDLEAKFKEMDEFQKSQKSNFKNYLDELVLQMTASEKDLEDWIQRNN